MADHESLGEGQGKVRKGEPDLIRSSVGLRNQSVKIKIYKEEDHRTMSWKNGLGTTKEIAIHPINSNFVNDRFLWRLSYNLIKLEKTILKKLALSA
jgi:hypothetical protein